MGEELRVRGKKKSEEEKNGTMQSAYVTSSSSRMAGKMISSSSNATAPRTSSSRRVCYASMTTRRTQQLTVSSRKVCDGTAVSSVGILVECRPRSSASSVSIAHPAAVRCRAAAAHKSVARAELAMSSSVPVRIYGKHLKLTDSIREHAEEKVAHAVRNYTNMASHVEVNLSVKGHAAKGAEEHKAEVTVYTRHHGLIRAEERSSEQGNIYEAIDLVSDKLVRALRRTKEKKQRKERRGSVSKSKKLENGGGASIRAKRNAEMEEQIELEIERSHVSKVAPSNVSPYHDTNIDSVVVRVKQFEMPPMTVSDAIEAVENIDHDWYLFKNSETGDMNVLYARNEGGYGLVVPSNDDEEELLDTNQSMPPRDR